ncbi:MAG: hypothetical protein PHO92_00605 [Candidatus Peribacteraceae bacterium]|nr:hypothetical protein [Candidatus Peribacteraceae bacterium]
MGKTEEFDCEHTAREIVLDAFSQHTGATVSAEEKLGEIGLDSLEKTELLIELSDSCDHALQQVFPDPPEIELDDTAYQRAGTVADLIQMVADRLRQAITA